MPWPPLIIKLTFSHANINLSEVEDNFQLASGWIKSALACSRLSDSGEDATEKGTRKVSCLRFLNSADPTISESVPG